MCKESHDNGAQMMQSDHPRYRKARTPKGKGKGNNSGFQTRLGYVEQGTDLNKVLKERILDSRVEFFLQELLGIAKEFHDLLVDLVKRKRQTTKESAPKVNVNTNLMNDTKVEDEILNSHYTKPHWARATMETLV